MKEIETQVYAAHERLIREGQFEQIQAPVDYVSFKNPHMTILFSFSRNRYSECLNFDTLKIRLGENLYSFRELLAARAPHVDLNAAVKKGLDEFVGVNKTYQNLIEKYLLAFFRTGRLFTNPTYRETISKRPSYQKPELDEFLKLENPLDRREMLRWIFHDHDKGNSALKTIFEQSIRDSDWEVRLSTMLACGKLRMKEFCGQIEVMKLAPIQSGLNEQEISSLEGMRKATLDLLKGARSPDEPTLSGETLPQEYYLRMVAREGTMKALTDAFLLYTSLTSPAYPLQKEPIIPKGMLHHDGRFFLGDIEFMRIPDYTAFVGTSKITYHPIKLIKVPNGTFVSKNPIKNGEFYHQETDVHSAKDFAKVTWKDATEFCERFSKRHHVGAYIPNSNTWETVVRGHTGRIFPWGNTLQIDQNRLPNMWGLEQTFGHGGEWTSNTIKGGRVITRGEDITGRCAPLSFCEPDLKRSFRIIMGKV